MSVLIKLQFSIANALGFIIERRVENENRKNVSSDWLEIQLIKMYFDH